MSEKEIYKAGNQNTQCTDVLMIYLKPEYDLLCFSKLQLHCDRHVWSSDHVHYQGELGIVEIE